MRIHTLTTAEQLAALAEPWRRLARGVPFRGGDWLAPWWEHYGRGRGGLYTLACFEDETLVAVAPWYRRRTPLGWVVRALGDGAICSDYLGVPCAPGREHAVAAALAAHLSAADSAPGWDLL